MKKNLLFAACLSMSMATAAMTPALAKTSGTSMKVYANDDQINIKVSKATSDGDLYAFDANTYASDDRYKGIGQSSQGTLIGSISKGESKTFTIERKSDSGYDNVYKKYYLLKGNKIVKGPVYATSISATGGKFFKQKSIKGLFPENKVSNLATAKSLGASSVTLNIGLDDLMYKDSSVAPSDAIQFDSNGKTYYFNKASVDKYDQYVSTASSKKMNVVAIAVPFYTDNTNTYPEELRYNSPKSTITMGTNTSNATGRDDYIAMMEFLGSRYSSGEHGYISTYVVSNEIDFTHYFYATSNFNKYMEEYARSLRLANLAVKKYSSKINVAVPFTHYWAKSAKQMFNECPSPSFAPKKMLEWLAKQTNARGAYNWAIAPHPYGVVNTRSNMPLGDSSIKCKGKKVLTGSYKTSGEVTFTNLEVLDQFLNTKAMKYGGKKRSVYLTESGASSSNMSSKQLKEQAMSFAMAYYKAANLSCIKSFNYYRFQDHKEEAENHLTCGLLNSNGKKKPVYNVYKNIDKKKSAASKYLKYVKFKKNGSKTVNKVKSWPSAMNIYSKKFKFSWKKVVK